MNNQSLQINLAEKGRLDSSIIVDPCTQVSSLSVFSDQIWYMESLVKLPGLRDRAKKWDFGATPGFPNGFALSLAEYAYARLYRPVATQEREAQWLTVYNELSVLNKFAQYCERLGLDGFHEVDHLLYEQFLKSIQYPDKMNNNEKITSDDRIKRITGFIYKFWEYRSAISKPLQSMPFGKPIGELFEKDHSQNIPYENATPVIPEPVYASIMAAALDYVLTHSSTIIDTWIEFRDQWNSELSNLNLSGTTAARRMDRIFKHVSSNKPAKWLSSNWASYGNMYDELQQLRTACTLVILAYSGIRVSELLSLEASCSVTNEYKEGHYRYYINTVLHKHKGNGSRDSWVVINEVVQAIKILEQLTAKARLESKDNRLMLTDGSNSFFSIKRSYIGVKTSEFTSEAISRQIESFQNYCNNKLNRPKIPEWTDENGLTKPWQFNTRQFRRTLARHIARQPFGIIAGMLQYKHVQVAMFEGYAGIDPEWDKIFHEEQISARVDILEELAMDLSNGQVAGVSGDRLKDKFKAEFRGRAEDFRPSQIVKWLENSQKSLFVGKYNFCFFDPTKALCTKGQIDLNKPVLNSCVPELCTNACVSRRHAPAWSAQLKQAEEFAAIPNLPELQRIVIQDQVSSLRIVVTNLGD